MLDILSKSLLELPYYFTDANKRIFAIYLISAITLSIPVFIKVSKIKTLPAFFRYLLPKEIWLHESAKQDYKLWIINKILKAFLFAPIVLTMVPIALGLSDLLESSFGKLEPFTLPNWTIIGIFTTALFLVDDFTRFLLHWILHKVPFLWEFHKVHHSAKVLTPFTIYRSHPVESYLYACRMAIVQGVVVGFGYYLFGATLSMYDILGANVFVFLFNFFGSNLRHSHVWLSWGDKIESVFISPAQHQIHHSDNPVHFDKNLGAALAIWDRLFGTYIKASKVGKLSFGAGQYDAGHNSILAIYVKPFIMALKTFKLKSHK
ncbi:sterol desaturase family protein [Pseudoalteromonas denitrificans]|uniref:Sterol desaturase/sphingolipid hydroxylase, fatty acid hydroxylase superfamily n=1 Tax=Pseudoalteromonas denitrificans DSM 6059 TaxID=1123010 RepID=A0A1I1FLG1_9GAMM|nr:sterol desaturase family protein [Pseudoalteromonas denitrificans]SFC00359.1 Sterol desaturase/sphingolipid hydroxylase, fatty acid hydroxylase superfamily [Pseudoalteromonas denitrificans DSM 6059]